MPFIAHIKNRLAVVTQGVFACRPLEASDLRGTPLAVRRATERLYPGRRWMRNSADCVRWFALAGYGSRALSAVIAVDHIAIAGSTVAGISIFSPVYVGASISAAVLFDLGTANRTAKCGDLSR